MVMCYICREEHSVYLSRQFHSFPSDAERREKWFNSIGYTVDTYKNKRICSDHFTEDDYYYTGTPILSRRLKKTAIPSVLTQRSCRSSKEDTKSNIQNNNQNESLIDIEYESTMDTQHQSAIDVQQSTIDNHDNSTIQHNNLILAKPIVVENTVTHNNINRRRKRCNDIEKIFLKTGKYNIECIRKTEFATNQAWNRFIKYINYNRYLQKLSVTRKSRIQKKIVTMQSVIQTLKTKDLIKTNVINALKNVIKKIQKKASKSAVKRAQENPPKKTRRGKTVDEGNVAPAATKVRSSKKSTKCKDAETEAIAKANDESLEEKKDTEIIMASKKSRKQAEKTNLDITKITVKEKSEKNSIKAEVVIKNEEEIEEQNSQNTAIEEDRPEIK